ncbi:MAG: VIT domain-containing protein [Spirulinaceae cyanobacterium]
MKTALSLSISLLFAGLGGFAATPFTPAAMAQAQTTHSQRNEMPPPSHGLFAVTEDGEQRIFPLQHTEVNAQIAGNVSRVEVTQTFENPFDVPLEAVYVFPLPDEAAVDDMEIKIGDRIIKGDIKERAEARAIYEQARDEGRTAGLLEQERANIFTQSLANIKPGEAIDVTIRYTDSLQFEGGDYEFVFPMVLGPRFIPGTPENPDTPTPDPTRENWGQATDRVPDAERITPPVLPPGTRSGHDINVTVTVDAGGLVQDVRSPSHQILTEQNGEIVTVQLDPSDTIPNKDLVLRYQVSGQDTQATVLTQTGDQGGHFALYLIPALDYKPNEIVAKDVVFLIDTSGSQRGEPIAQSKRLMERFIAGLNPDDTFSIIDFANAAQALSPEPLRNTQSNRDRALAYVNQLQSGGGTQLLNGIDTVLNFPIAAPGRLRSIVLLTDGLIGDDNAVIARVQQELPYGNRLYGFGVGSSVNRFLLDRLAEAGRGTLHVVRHDEPIDEVVEQFFEQINNPVLTNIRVSWQGTGDDPDIYPQYLPDLFANQPLVLFGRKADGASGTLRVTGITAGGRRYLETFEVGFADEGNLAIAQLWGRARIKELMTQMVGGETRSGVDGVTETALNYRLLSQYTAFVAVSEEVRVDPDGTSRTVEVPVELPDGTSYDGFFGSGTVDDSESRVGFLDPTSGANSHGRLGTSYSFGVNTAGNAGNAPSPTSSAPAPVPTARPAPPPPSPSPMLPNVVAPSVGDIAVNRAQGRPPQEALTETEEVDIDGLTAEPPAPTIFVQVAEAEGFSPEVIESLNRHFWNFAVPGEASGEVMFELELVDGRVQRIIWDDQASALTEDAVVQRLRAYLAYWQHPEGATGTYTVSLRVR